MDLRLRQVAVLERRLVNVAEAGVAAAQALEGDEQVTVVGLAEARAESRL